MQEEWEEGDSSGRSCSETVSREGAAIDVKLWQQEVKKWKQTFQYHMVPRKWRNTGSGSNTIESGLVWTRAIGGVSRGATTIANTRQQPLWVESSSKWKEGKESGGRSLFHLKNHGEAAHSMGRSVVFCDVTFKNQGNQRGIVLKGSKFWELPGDVDARKGHVTVGSRDPWIVRDFVGLTSE